jgi:hypothetical protein
MTKMTATFLKRDTSENGNYTDWFDVDGERYGISRQSAADTDWLTLVDADGVRLVDVDAIIDVTNYGPKTDPLVFEVASAIRTVIVSYFYRPIAHYQGAVLKCHGIASPKNRARMMAEPGTIELKGWRGDRIDAVTHEPFQD